MDKEKLRELLTTLIEEYIEDRELVTNLVATLDDPKAKYILGEIDLNKSKQYSIESKKILQEIAFYYC